MKLKPLKRQLPLSVEQATVLVRRHVGAGLTVTTIRALYGGSINTVLELTTDGEPASIVAKLNDASNAASFERERASLELYAERTCLPTPRIYATISDDPAYEGSGLLMEKAPGATLADARFSPEGARRFQQQLADAVVELHRHHRPTFGSAHEPRAGAHRWLENFQPKLEREFLAVRDQLNTRARTTIDGLINHLDRWIPETAEPTLTHGDLWANNILVDDRHPDHPRITAFIDGAAAYCDPEYELAYLRVFKTADKRFFQRYAQTHPLSEGFDRRCRVYWLHTMLAHVHVFGRQYVDSCENLADELTRLR